MSSEEKSANNNNFDPDIRKTIEKHGSHVARTIRPFLTTRSVHDVNEGQRHEIKTLRWTVVMNGTEKEFTLPKGFDFNKPDSVVITPDMSSFKHFNGKVNSVTGGVDSATLTTLVDDALAETFSNNDDLNGFTLRITEGPGSGQGRTILDYDAIGTPGECTVADWDVTPTGESSYKIILSGEAIFVDSALSGQFPDNEDLKNAMVEVLRGTGSGQRRIITDYNASLGKCTIAQWSEVPDDTSKFKITQNLSIYAQMIGKDRIKISSSTYLKNQTIRLLLEGY